MVVATAAVSLNSFVEVKAEVVARRIRELESASWALAGVGMGSADEVTESAVSGKVAAAGHSLAYN